MRATAVAVCCMNFVGAGGVFAQPAADDFRSTAELLESFDAGITAGRADLLGGSTQYGCLQEARRLDNSVEPGGARIRYCAVNFYPDGHAGNTESRGAGLCEAVREPCKQSSSTGPAGVVTAPVSIPLDNAQLSNATTALSWGAALSACANLAAYVHGVWTAGPTTTIARDVSQLECIGRAKADQQYCAVNFYPTAGSEDSSGYGMAGRCEAVQAPCEAVFSHDEGIVSTAALPVDQDAGCEWTADTLPALFGKINAACCEPGQDCGNGPPTICTSECHDIVLGAWRDNVCKRVMLDLLGERMASFVSLCQDPTRSANGGK